MPACCSAVACCSCTLFSKSQRERNDCENISRPSICRSYTSTVSMLSVLRATCWCLHPTCTVGERVECRVWMPAALDWLRVKCPAIIIWVQYLALLIGGPSCYPLWGDIGIPLAVAPWSPYYNIPAKTSIERERERERCRPRISTLNSLDIHQCSRGTHARTTGNDFPVELSLQPPMSIYIYI